MKYDPSQIEPRWQQHWAQHQTFAASNPGDAEHERDRPKYYVLAMFPYPSGAGLHMGHAINYTSTDIIARYQRMRGYNVLHPIGYDAFGLPAEQYAIEHNVHPRTTTEQNIGIITDQLKKLGLAFDWDRCFATTDVSYYKWTQWIFLQLYNSWFDPYANAARPIDELQQQLQNGEYEVGPDGELVALDASGGIMPIAGGPVGSRKWQELSPQQRRNLLDEYRLAYLAEVPVNWCPALGTVLANEEVTNEGLSERGNHPVYQRPLKQWMLRITQYAERLLEGLDYVDWPEPIKLMQRNWIGRSEGAEVQFPLAPKTAEAASAASSDTSDENADNLTVFTTRPDTLFGATYMVLAPEHPLVDTITTGDQYHAVNEYQKAAAQKTEVDRLAEGKTKTGVFTGAYARNPVNGENIPIYIGEYVMMDVGTGAIMAVPAHDERDFAFAQQNGLPIRAVVQPADDWLSAHAHEKADAETLRRRYLEAPGAFDEAFTGEGTSVNSANADLTLDGRATADAKQAITDWLEKQHLGRRKVQYKLRDWLFSRQRYWGEPFPIAHCPEGGTKPLDEDELPVELPAMDDFRPSETAGDGATAEVPKPPLDRAPDDWKYIQKDGERCVRELNTMPQWAGSCWYYLRFCDAHNDQRFVGEDAEAYWMKPQKGGHDRDASRGALAAATHGGVDMYIGGVEHAVLHLLYARFWHKVLYDLGEVTTPEPFARLYNQGYVQAHAYTDPRGVYVPAEQVVEAQGKYYYQGEEVTQEFGKMGKSLKNSISPDEVIQQYGADALRLYLMYLGPLDQSKTWRPGDIIGVYRFLQRLWRNLIDEDTEALRVSDDAPDDELDRKLHGTIKRAGDAMEQLSFNVAIAALIELNNELVQRDTVPRVVAETIVRLLAPLAPHVSEELWQRLGHAPSVADAEWPGYDESKLAADEIELPVQVNGKVRSRITVPADAGDDTIEDIARRDEKVRQAVGETTIRKVIVVKGRMVNIVAK